MKTEVTKGLIPHILESTEVFPPSDLVDNDKFIQWAKEIFSTENLTAIPRQVWVSSEETAQIMIDAGMSPESVIIIKPFDV